MESHPSRVRGLKYWTGPSDHIRIKVAPFTGAWIEMQTTTITRVNDIMSHPSRVRGLKWRI